MSKQRKSREKTKQTLKYRELLVTREEVGGMGEIRERDQESTYCDDH